ncbi:MAG: hypothetical protein V2I33_17370 [Kangiellaceae bacterium]|jgi:hypothetical protein|nr:hypothetical protein [Kangiellaceae bacterium]
MSFWLLVEFLLVIHITGHDLFTTPSVDWKTGTEAVFTQEEEKKEEEVLQQPEPSPLCVKVEDGQDQQFPVLTQRESETEGGEEDEIDLFCTDHCQRETKIMTVNLNYAVANNTEFSCDTTGFPVSPPMASKSSYAVVRLHELALCHKAYRVACHYAYQYNVTYCRVVYHTRTSHCPKITRVMVQNNTGGDLTEDLYDYRSFTTHEGGRLVAFKVPGEHDLLWILVYTESTSSQPQTFLTNSSTSFPFLTSRSQRLRQQNIRLVSVIQSNGDTLLTCLHDDPEVFEKDEKNQFRITQVSVEILGYRFEEGNLTPVGEKGKELEYSASSSFHKNGFLVTFLNPFSKYVIFSGIMRYEFVRLMMQEYGADILQAKCATVANVKRYGEPIFLTETKAIYTDITRNSKDSLFPPLIPSSSPLLEMNNTDAGLKSKSRMWPSSSNVKPGERRKIVESRIIILSRFQSSWFLGVFGISLLLFGGFLTITLVKIKTLSKPDIWYRKE